MLLMNLLLEFLFCNLLSEYSFWVFLKIGSFFFFFNGLWEMKNKVLLNFNKIVNQFFDLGHIALQMRIWFIHHANEDLVYSS